MKLQVEENLLAHSPQTTDDISAGTVKQFHTDLVVADGISQLFYKGNSLFVGLYIKGYNKPAVSHNHSSFPKGLFHLPILYHKRNRRDIPAYNNSLFNGEASARKRCWS